MELISIVQVSGPPSEKSPDYCAEDGCWAKFGVFKWRYRCAECGKDFCRGHHNGRHCGKCWPIVNARIEKEAAERAEAARVAFAEAERKRQEEVARQAKINEAAKHVEVWPRTYKGDIPYNPTGPQIDLVTAWHRDRSVAKFALQIEAAKQGLDLVFHAEEEREVAEEPSFSGNGTHHYTIFRYTGIGAHYHIR